MEAEEITYTDQHGFQIHFNPMTFNSLDSPRPMAVSFWGQKMMNSWNFQISKKRHSSSASSRYKADPLRSGSHQTNTIDTRLTEVDTDEENYLVPNSAERIKLDPNGCKYTKVAAPFTGNGEKEPPEKHHYENDGIGTEYLNVDETTTEEEEPAGAFPFPRKSMTKSDSQPSEIARNPSQKSSPIRENKYINQAESVV